MTWKKPIKFLLLRANWSDAVKISRQFLTTVTTAKSRLEQRSALRAIAKRAIKFTLSAFTPAESAYIHRKLYKEMHALLGIPIWPDFVFLTVQAVAGTNTLTVDSTDHKAFAIGGQVVLLDPDDPDIYEIGVIQSFTSTQIVLTANLLSTWDAGTEIYPIMPARIQQVVKVPWHTDSLSSVSIDAQEFWQATTTSTTSTTSTTTTSTTST